MEYKVYLEKFQLLGIDGLEELYVENLELIESIIALKTSSRTNSLRQNNLKKIYRNFQNNLFLLTNLRTISQKNPKIYNSILQCASEIFLSEEITHHHNSLSIANSLSLFTPSKILKISLLYYLYPLVHYEGTFEFQIIDGKKVGSPTNFIEDYLFNFIQDKEIPQIYYVKYLCTVVKLLNSEEDIVAGQYWSILSKSGPVITPGPVFTISLNRKIGASTSFFYDLKCV